MSSLFLDTSGWFASMSVHDPKYAVAQARLVAATQAGNRIVTTSLVIAELHALLIRREGLATARHFVDEVFDEQAQHVVYPDAEVVTAARIQWLRRFLDQPFSLCDAVSFEVMRRERITSALATDRHFAIAGFEILS